jgi:hypothetical protein
METQSRQHEARALALHSRAQRPPLEIKTLEITRRRDSGSEEFELLEMRYQHALAFMSLEELFAEGRLNCF